MRQAFETNDYKEVKKCVKIIVGKDAEDADKKASSFEKLHNIIEIIQRSPNVMVLFYTENLEKRSEDDVNT